MRSRDTIIGQLLAGLKQQVKGLADAAGLEIRRKETVPAPAPLYDDPVEVVHRRNSHDFAALRCPLTQCVEFNGMSFSADGWHPFVAAARQYLEGSVAGYEGSILERYYDVWKPANAGDALLAAPGPATLEAYPAYVKHTPWSHRSVSEAAAYMARVIELENSGFGDKPLSPSAGYGLQGPVSRAKGRIEYERLVSLVDSIQKHGYDRSKGDVTVEALRRDDEVRCVVVHGHHRAAALAALGHEYLPAIPLSLIEARYVEHWPGVYRREWSREVALRYFHALFAFDSRGWAAAHGLC